MSSFRRTKDMAMKSTSSSSPRTASRLSFSVSAGIEILAPGRLIPLLDVRIPPLTTWVMISSPSIFSTRSSTSPSSMRMRSPGETSRGSCLYVVETRPASPGTSSVVIAKRAPLTSSTPPRWAMGPVRILGPARSCAHATARPSFALTSRTMRIRSRCSSGVPWEKFIRATSMPARMSRSIISGLDVAGPRVATILVLRMDLLTPRSSLGEVLAGARPESTFDPNPDDRRQDLVARQHRTLDSTGDLGLADPSMIADGNLDGRDAGAGGLRLHLRRPSIVTVLHVEREKRLVADGTEGAEVRESVAVESVEDARSEPISPAGVRRQSAPLPFAQDAGADHEVGSTLEDGLHETDHLRGPVAVVSVHEDHDLGRRLGEVGDSGEASLSVARAGLGEHRGAGSLRDLGSPVAASVIDHDDLTRETSRYLGENFGEGSLFVEGGNDDDNPHWAC